MISRTFKFQNAITFTKPKEFASAKKGKNMQKNTIQELKRLSFVELRSPFEWKKKHTHTSSRKETTGKKTGTQNVNHENGKGLTE